jgi:ribose 1,5-bisphosphokinase PhnN
MTLLATHAGAEAPVAAGNLEVEACAAAGEDIVAECGRLWVYENRATQTGRVIPIYFIRIPAREAALRKRKMARPGRETSNSVLETLAEWNTYLTPK